MILKSSGVSFLARRIFLVSSALCLALLTVLNCKGSTWTWTGGGGLNGNWNDSANWGSAGIPGNGDTVIFEGAAGLKNTNNISSLTLNQICFLSGGFNVYGNGFTLTNSLVCTNFSGSINIYNNFTNATGNLFILTSNGITLTLYGNLDGTQGVTKAGAGTLVYDGPSDNIYTGTTLISAGILDLNVGGAYAFEGPLVIGDGSGTGSPMVQDLQSEELPAFVPITINENGALNLNNYNETIGTNLIFGGGTLETGSGTVTLSPNCTITMTNNPYASIMGNLNTGSGTLTIQGIGTLGFNANVSGFANIVINGEVYTIWYGNNTYSANVTDNSIFSLDLASSTALGNITNTLTLNGSAFVILEGSVNLINQSVTFNNTNYYNSEYGSIYAYAGNSSWQSSFVLDGNCIANVATNCTLNLNGPISGPFGVAMMNPGTVIYSGSTENTYSGLTTVGQGELDLAKSGTLAIAPFEAGMVIGDGTNVATVVYKASQQIYSIVTPVVVNNNASLNLNGFSDIVSPLTMNSGVVNNTAAGLLALYQVYGTGASTINGTVVPSPVIVSNSGSLTINANILPYEGYGLISTGPGELFLTASNSFTGPTIVQQGFVILQNSWALGATNSPVVVSNTATLELGGGIDVTNKPLVLNGPGAQSDFGALDVEEGVNVWAGPITNNANSTLDAWNSGSELHINGAISGPGGLECFGDASGGGTHFFEGLAANTYTGLTTVDAGCTLELAKTLAVTSVARNVVVNGELVLESSVQLTTGADVLVNPGGLFSFGPYYDYVNTLHGYGSVNFGTGGYVEIGAAGGSSEFDGTISGTGYPGGYTIIKDGAGTFTLTGNNTYLNQTLVSGGVLMVNGQQLQSPVIVSSSATLTGSGVVGSITGSGTVAPGNGGPAMLTCSNLTFTSSGTYSVLMTGPAPGSGYAQLNPIDPGPANALANAALQVVPNFTSPVGIGQQFTIINNATAHPFSGTFSGLPEGAQFTAGGFTFRISYVGGTGNDVVLTLLGVPGKTITLGAAVTGWYDSTGYHTNSNMNYVAGGYGTGPNYRNFFVFNAPVSSNAIVHAELLVNDYTILNPSNQDTYVLRKVATPIPTLVASWTGQTPIYNDLGTGAVYSVRSIATNESGQVAIIPLNAQFINDMTAASGGQIALGGSVANLVATNPAFQYVFGASDGGGTDVRLRLIYGTNQLVTSASHGWYDSFGTHNAGSPNYVAGYSDDDTFRDYFMFNLPSISGQLVDAQLLLNAYEVDSTNGDVTFQLYDVTNAITQLTNNQSSATNIYADLGSGMVYGGADIYTNQSGQTAAIPLDPGFLAAAQAASGGSIALGGAVTSLNGSTANQDVFGFSSASTPSDAQLWLGYYTRPVLYPTFIGTPVNLGGGMYQFNLTGTIGITNEIQGSFDFQRWDYITDVPMPEGNGTFISTNNSVLPYRFYRAEPLQ